MQQIKIIYTKEGPWQVKPPQLLVNRSPEGTTGLPVKINKLHLLI